MAEEKDLKERLLEIAREQNIAESVANGIMACLKGEKTDGLFVPVRLLFSGYALPSAFSAYTALLK